MNYCSKYPLNDLFEEKIDNYEIVQFDSDELIIKEGQKLSYLYYLIEGKAKLFLTHENGSITLVNFIQAPSFIGEMELLGTLDCAKGVKALSKCICYRIDVNKYYDQMINDKKFLRKLCIFLSKKASDNTDNYSRNQSLPLNTRFSSFILMTQQDGIYREKHTETAQYLGVSYRHLLYVLADFVKKGYVEKTLQGYRIVNKEALIQMTLE